MADVLKFPKSNLSDIPNMLRLLADDIESGRHGDVAMVLAVIPRVSDWPDVFGFGPEGDTSDAAIIGHLDLAKTWFANNLTGRA